MRSTLGIVLFFIGNQLGFGQCTVDLGDDIHVCTQLQTGFPATQLGNQLSVTNATPPLTYIWSIEPITYFSTTLYASTFLDDTSSVNPTVLEIWEDSLTFFLELIDVNQQVCYDTITVSASLFGTHLGSVSYTITAGDSVNLFFGPNIVSNY